MARHPARLALMMGRFGIAVGALALATAFAADAAVDARMGPWQGAPAILVNGRPQPPMTFTLCPWRALPPDRERDYLRKIGAAGLKIHYVACATRWHSSGRSKEGSPRRHRRGARRYGVIDRDLHSNVWIGPVLPAQYLNPGFFIDDPKATVLGRYCCNGKPALAMIERDGVKSVYCATQVMRSDLLASIAEFAGCHIYAKDDDILYANESYVAVHASSDGRKTIRFKRRCSPYEVYEKKSYGTDVDRIEVDMRLGETKTWCVCRPEGPPR